MPKEETDNVRALMVELINALPGYSPLDTGGKSSDPEIRYTLASMYKDKAFRDYLIRAIRLTLEGFQHVVDDRGLWVQQGRLLVIKELLAVSKQMHEEMLKLDKSLKDKKA